MSRTVVAVGLGLVLTLDHSSALAQEKKETRTPDPAVAKTGRDFHVQGEYSGVLTTGAGRRRVGLQVVARGRGKFDLVLHPGGLPGEGGEHKKRKWVKGVGSSEVKTDWGVVSIGDGKATLKDDAGNSIGTLRRVERKSSTLGKRPPRDAVVLFDGTSTNAIRGGRMTKDGLLKEGFQSKQLFQSFHLHLEFRTPWEPERRGQGRGNSGCYMQGRYELQIVDSIGEAGGRGDAGGIYSIAPPKLNMAYPPLRWQTYDVEFTAPKLIDGEKVFARMTVRHNGVVIHERQELRHATTACLEEYRNTGLDAGPIYIQNHGNSVRFRNIWLVEK